MGRKAIAQRAPRSVPADTAPAGALAALLTVVTLAVYLPTFQNDGFITWGDDELLLGADQWSGLAPDNIRWMFTTTHQGQYHPLTWLSYAVDRVTWGDNAQGYHLTNLILHVLAVLLVYGA